MTHLKFLASRLYGTLFFAAATLAASLAVAPKSLAAGKTCGTGADGQPLQLGIGVDCSGSGSPVIGYLSGILKVLTPLVGVVIVGMIVAGGIMISSANGNASQVQKGVEYIRNAVLALILFIFMNVILRFLLPGL